MDGWRRREAAHPLGCADARTAAADGPQTARHVCSSAAEETATLHTEGSSDSTTTGKIHISIFFF